ncbi:hypothetical protein GCM10008983_20510 [Lentibacillus halophilus]|uniref:DUF4190 domain-containing protein n=1 Tax=Lentibacillus halophilus TaxID=295065 RepID=A0ABN0ZCR9_9BACI
MDETNRRANNSENGSKLDEQSDTGDIVETNFNDGKRDMDEVQSRRDEEFAAEITADDAEAKKDDDTDATSIYGWVAVALSIISYFLMPIILGGAGVILGFISRNRGSETLGNTAIVAGGISILIRLFILPYV